MFICEICKKNPATVHLTDIHNNEKKELHICQSCAEKKGISFQHSFSLQDLLKGLSKKQEDRQAADVVCPQCGLSYRTFQSRGRLGCPNDYRAFAEQLEPMLERIHGKVQHVGKAPGGPGTAGEQQQEVAALTRQMRQAVESEDYERAAELRDRIGDLKRDAQAEGDKQAQERAQAQAPAREEPQAEQSDAQEADEESGDER